MFAAPCDTNIVDQSTVSQSKIYIDCASWPDRPHSPCSYTIYLQIQRLITGDAAGECLPYSLLFGNEDTINAFDNICNGRSFTESGNPNVTTNLVDQKLIYGFT